jgi:hypothetical protein
VLWVSGIAGLFAIASAMLKWGPPLKRFRIWLYRHTAHYRVQQLEELYHERIQALEDKLALVSEHTRTTGDLLGVRYQELLLRQEAAVKQIKCYSPLSPIW